MYSSVKFLSPIVIAGLPLPGPVALVAPAVPMGAVLVVPFVDVLELLLPHGPA